MPDKKYFVGPKLGSEIFNGSLGEFILSKMKEQPQNNIIQTNGITGEDITVGELLSLAIQVAESLRANKIGAEDVVALAGRYSKNLLSTLLGTIIHNSVIFPVDFSFKQLELQYLFKIANPKIVFSDKESLPYVTAALLALKSGAKVIILDEEMFQGPNEDLHILSFRDFLHQPSLSSDEFRATTVEDAQKKTVAILASSGTTGLPKAVLLSHRNLIYQITVWGGVSVVQNKLRYLLSTYHFWLTGFNAFLYSCCHGFPCVYQSVFEPEQSLRIIEKYKVEWVFMNPTNFHHVITSSNFEHYDVSSASVILLGGASVPESLIDLIRRRWQVKDLQIGQMYGCTELTGNCTEPLGLYPPVSAGFVVRGTTAKVIDDSTGQLLGPGETGELAFKSEWGMMQGYVNMPVETKNAIDTEGFYRMGDIGYITEDNIVYVTGRVKDLITWNGYKIVPNELESVIMQMNGVKEAVVVAKPHSLESYEPTAAVVKEAESSLSEEDIVKFVADTLSARKQLHGGVTFVDFIPKNSNGKILRNKVKEMLGIFD